MKVRSGRKNRKTTTAGIDPIDCGTKEFGHRYTLKPELIGASTGHSVHMRVVDETAIDRLLLKGMINLDEHIIGNKVAGDLHRANFSKIAASKLEPSSGRPDPHAFVFTDNLVEVGKLFTYLDEKVGVDARNLVTNVLLDMRDVRSETELELFRIGLLAIAIRLEKRRERQAPRPQPAT